MNDKLLCIRDLQVRFDLHGAALEAVRGVSFDVPAGRSVALVGESGSGKSVIAKAIMGLLPTNARITRGEILFTDGDLQTDIAQLHRDSAAMRALRGRRIGLIFQEPMASLSPLHTLGDQVSEALFLHQDISKREGLAATREMLALVGFNDPARALSLFPFELSGGMRQRAMIAMALICRPALLIADEPTTALDVTIQAQILKLIKRLQSRFNMAVLMITHDLGVVANVADEVVVAYHGEIMECGDAGAIFTRTQHTYTRGLLRAQPGFDMPPGARLQPLREINPHAGELLRARSDANANTGGAILRVQNVSKSFFARKQAWALRGNLTPIRAVDDVGFELLRGESLGLVGESGSGKSTLGRLIARAMLPDAGRIIYHAENSEAIDVTDLEGDALFAYRRQVQYIFQDPVGSLNPGMTVFDIIREPMVIHELGDADYQAEMCGELMRLVGLDARHLRRYPHSFSGGQRQRIGIARALALRPSLLICDEPVSALDVSIQAQVLNLLKDLQQALGLSYLFISHNLAVVDYIAARIAVMHHGKIVEIAPGKALFARAMHPYTRELLRAIPTADLSRPLDFSQIAEVGEAAADWPPPFNDAHGKTHAMREVAPQHFVRAYATPAG